MRKYLLFLLIFIIFLFASNNWITVSYHTINTGKVLDKKIRLVQISDLHNKTFPFDQSSLIRQIENQEPDIIVMTGDILDSRNTKPSAVYQFLKNLNSQVPIYYVTGNHEKRIIDYDSFERTIKDLGVTVINNTSLSISEDIQLIGIHDLAFFSSMSQYSDTLSQLNPQDGQFSVLLSHRPELFELYEDHGYDLILSGHAHGGQFRLPSIGGLFAPNQGLFPKYTAGLHTINTSHLIISRGLGNSVIPIRIFNQPELVVIDLE